MTTTVFTTILVALITAVLGPIIVAWFKLKMEKKSLNTLMFDALETSTLVDTQLEIVLEELECDRVWIAQFHNGGHFYPTGKSIQKFSIFYEVNKVGISGISHVFSNIPCSLYPKAFQHMMEHGGIFIPNFNDPKVATYGLKSAAESVGTQSSYVLPLYTLDDKYIGTFGVDYVSKKKRLTKDEWEHLQIQASRIAGYLSSYLNK